MKIIRYSLEGFKPQKQTNHMEHVNYHLNDFDIDEYPEFMRYQIQKNHEEHVKFYKEHLEDLRCGCWFFIDGYKNNQSLNHLQQRVPCWEAEIDDDALVYDCNWEKVISVTDPIVKIFGCYISKREMRKIHNVRKRKANRNIMTALPGMSGRLS